MNNSACCVCVCVCVCVRVCVCVCVRMRVCVDRVRTEVKQTQRPYQLTGVGALATFDKDEFSCCVFGRGRCLVVAIS